ncbi:MAG: cytochrome c oxidase assembly protein subunit 11 [Lentimonas sp.]|jgi:cytochrome c oxidase assembly protein subunit 11
MSNNPVQDKFIKSTIYIVLGILLMVFIAIQPYNIFCKIKKTCQPVTFSSFSLKPKGQHQINFIFSASIPEDLKNAVEFEPITKELLVKNGKNIINSYRVKNLDGKNITARAMFGVEPQGINKYLERIECACFNKQPVDGNGEEEMPVNFRIDPKIENDEEFKNLKEIRINYEIYLED